MRLDRPPDASCKVDALLEGCDCGEPGEAVGGGCLVDARAESLEVELRGRRGLAADETDVAEAVQDHHHLALEFRCACNLERLVEKLVRANPVAHPELVLGGKSECPCRVSRAAEPLLKRQALRMEHAGSVRIACLKVRGGEPGKDLRCTELVTVGTVEGERLLAVGSTLLGVRS